ncbi:hypothetical protein OPIT5_28720 [Opitutaceae bacterium TAV5]|nr:hypothetical protein OPIT5_28720 [Opitutaceae bacterium TAV5]
MKYRKPGNTDLQPSLTGLESISIEESPVALPNPLP